MTINNGLCVRVCAITTCMLNSIPFLFARFVAILGREERFRQTQKTPQRAHSSSTIILECDATKPPNAEQVNSDCIQPLLIKTAKKYFLSNFAKSEFF